MAATLVFSQSKDAAIPVAALAGQARARFAAEITVLEASTDWAGTRLEPADTRLEPAGTRLDAAGVRLQISASGERGIFVLSARPVTPTDLERARDAEQRGRAAGMADLAARCPTVWSVEAEAGAPAWLLFELCAVLAFAALGPVLPADGSTLFGVRGARERAEKLKSGR